MNKIFSRGCLAGSLMLLFFAGSLSAAEKEGFTVPKEAVCVLDYKMQDASGNKLKDSSLFHNDAIAFGRPYTDIIKRESLENGLFAVKIGNSIGDKTSLCGTYIAHSDSLLPEKFIIEMNIKPLSATKGNVDIFSGQITPFFYKKPKSGAACRTYYPIKIMLKKGNQIQLIPSLRDSDGNIKPAYTPAKKIETGVFSNLRWVIDNNEVKFYLNRNLEYSKPLPGKIAYDHPDYYPGHVSFRFGSGGFDGLLGDFRIYDLDMAIKKKKVGIRIKTDKPVNFFTQTEKKEFFVWVDNFSSEKINGVFSYNSVDDKGESIFHGEFPAILKPKQANLIKITCPSETRGCFWLKCNFRKQNALLATREESYAVGAIRGVSQFPVSSPFGIHSAEPIGWGINIPDIGMKWVRVNFSRKYLEPVENQFRWELSDEVVNYHFKQGREMMTCLWGMPSWAVSEEVKKLIKDGKEKIKNTRNYPPGDWEKHKKYLRKIITRYRDKVNAWEVWNEANTGYWKGTPEEFIKLLKMTHKLIRELDPTATIVGPPICTSGWEAWSSEVLQLGAAKFMDVFAVHYLGGGYGGTLDPELVIQKSRDTRDMMKACGNKVLPIWDGESGYCTATRRGENSRPIGKAELKRRQDNKEGYLSDHMRPSAKNTVNSNAADEYTVSNISVRRMVLCLANAVDKTFIHPLGCWTCEKDLKGGNYRKGSDVLLPAIAWTTMVEKFCWAEFVRKIDFQGSNLYGYLFKDKRDGKNFAVFWCSKGMAKVNINPDSAKAKKSNIWGNPVSLTIKNPNFLSLTLSETPFYLEEVSEKINPLKKALFVAPLGFLSSGKNNNLAITVKNPLTRDISGKLTIKAPSGLMVEPESFSLNLKVNGEEKRNIQIKPASDLAGKECRFQVSFSSPDIGGEEMETVVCQVSRPAVPLSMKTNDIVIDGKADDDTWKKVKPFSVSQEEQVVVGRPLCYGDPTTIKKDKEWFGPHDLSADVYLAYDDKNLYLLAKVRDNVLTVNSRDKHPYTGDCLEIFIDGRPETKQANAQHSSGVCQLFLVSGDKEHPEATSLWLGRSKADNKQWGVRVASQKTEDGYNIEAVIPFSEKVFPELIVSKGKIIGFDISVNDADNNAKRKSQMIWRGTKNNYRDASKFGKLMVE